jgi:hypothetical protein
MKWLYLLFCIYLAAATKMPGPTDEWYSFAPSPYRTSKPHLLGRIMLKTSQRRCLTILSSANIPNLPELAISRNTCSNDDDCGTALLNMCCYGARLCIAKRQGVTSLEGTQCPGRSCPKLSVNSKCFQKADHGCQCRGGICSSKTSSK